MLFTIHTERQRKHKLQDDPVSNQTEQLTSKPDFILASLLSSVHFRCRDLWQVLLPGLTSDPYSGEDKTPLPRTSSNCYCCVLAIPSLSSTFCFAFSAFVLGHASWCTRTACWDAWDFLHQPGWGELPFVEMFCNLCLCPLMTVKNPDRSVTEPMLEVPFMQANPTLQGEEALFFHM